MTYAEIAKERDDLKTENEMLRSIMDKMLEKGKNLEKEIERLKTENEKRLNAIEDFTNKTCCLKCDIARILVKEFVEKLKDKLQNFIEDNEDYDGKVKSGILYVDVIGVIGKNGEIISLGLIDELLKEYEK